jgi:hypothetical protein
MRKLMRKEVAFLLAMSLAPLIALPASISDLVWLSGCWSASDQDAGSGEQWMPPAGGTMLGMNRTVRGNETVAFEFIRIVEQDDGSLVFVASPSGQGTTEFALVRLSDREVIFENPDHDFPQRIIYRLVSDEELLGRIEGAIDGIERAVDFPMKRIVCRSDLPAS